MKQVLQMTGVLLLQCGMGPDLVWQTDMANSLPVLVNIGVRKKTRERRICRYFELYNCHASWRCTNWDLTNDISKAISFDYRSTNDVLGLIRCCSALPTDRSFGEVHHRSPLCFDLIRRTRSSRAGGTLAALSPGRVKRAAESAQQRMRSEVI
jgi:hypothetical protein